MAHMEEAGQPSPPPMITSSGHAPGAAEAGAEAALAIDCQPFMADIEEKKRQIQQRQDQKAALDAQQRLVDENYMRFSGELAQAEEEATREREEQERQRKAAEEERIRQEEEAKMWEELERKEEEERRQEEARKRAEEEAEAEALLAERRRQEEEAAEQKAIQQACPLCRAMRFQRHSGFILIAMVKSLAVALSVTAFACAMSTDVMDMDNILAADAECAVGQECALNAVQKKAVVAQQQAEDSVEKFAAAVEEGAGDVAAEAQVSSGQKAQTVSDTEKWGPSPPPPTAAYNPYWNHQYGSPYGQMPPGFNPYGGSPYGAPGFGSCLNKIEGSSCMVFSCAKSRGPTTCNTKDYFCYCHPGFCSDGKACVPASHMYR
ncbi:unnamed protein product [Symbiodinium sp. CCMP2592]|nr:unnamed protein product [Symbiodinium sp. CCMP2592]